MLLSSLSVLAWQIRTQHADLRGDLLPGCVLCIVVVADDVVVTVCCGCVLWWLWLWFAFWHSIC